MTAFELPPALPLRADIPGRRTVAMADVTGDVVDLAIADAERLTARQALSWKLLDHRQRGKYRWTLQDDAPNPHKKIAYGSSWRWKSAVKQLERAIVAAKDDHHAELDRLAAERATRAES